MLEDFCLIGVPPRGSHEGELPTRIGDGAIIRSHTVIYAGNEIGENFQTGNKVNVRELNRIGDNVSIGTLSVVEHHAQIGNNVRIHTQAFIPEFSVLEDGCWIGPNVVLTNAKYPLSPGVKETLAGPIVRKRGEDRRQRHAAARRRGRRECGRRRRGRGRPRRPTRGRRGGQPGTCDQRRLQPALSARSSFMTLERPSPGQRDSSCRQPAQP